MATRENRPYAGSWTFNNKKIRRHVPDCIVKFNGETAMPSCAGCIGKIDLQDLITAVSVSNTTDTAPASCSITMSIPTNRRSCFFQDNKFKLHPGLEIHVYMRGYFSHSDLAAEGEDQNFDLSKAGMKPYYQVFHGVVTDVSHDFGGGFFSASLSCSDLLHFWQYQTIATNPSAYGTQADGNRTQVNFTGSKFTRKSPYSVVWSLYSSGHGDAGGHSWYLSDFTNVGIKSDVFQNAFWDLAGHYWKTRFEQPMGKLKMFGADGTMFNTFEQIMVSDPTLISKGDATAESARWLALADPGYDGYIGTPDTYFENLLAVFRNAQGGISADNKLKPQGADRYAFPSSALFFTTNTAWGGDTASKQSRRGYNVAGVTAFALDLGALGDVNMFDSQMTTKMDLASQVSKEIGFEFFIDMNGDFVFKPPFYNLDVSQNRVYVIKDIDLISFNASEKEPEVTAMKGTGGYYNNMASLLGKEYENRGMFVDWRLVAKYGWREQEFETTYLNDPKSIYYAAMNRIAEANKETVSGSVSIPLRAEMKMGFPVYLEPFDCFYYVSSVSHNFSFGSDCTTDLSLSAKRAKFYPPMQTESQFPRIEDVDFHNVYKPATPLFTKNSEGVPKYMGFPCVVMATDTILVNPLWLSFGEIHNALLNLGPNTNSYSVGDNSYEGLKTLILNMTSQKACGLRLTIVSGEPFSESEIRFVMGNNQLSNPILIRRLVSGPLAEMKKQIDARIADQTWKVGATGQTFQSAWKTQQDFDAYAQASPLGALFIKSVDRYRKLALGGFKIQDATNITNYLAALQYMKSNFRPDDQQPGSYRYYSSAIPNDLPNAALMMGQADADNVNFTSSIGQTAITQNSLVSAVHEIDTADVKQCIKVIDQGDGTYKIVDPLADPSAAQSAGGASVFEVKYGLPIKSWSYRGTPANPKINPRGNVTDHYRRGEVASGLVFKVVPTQDIKTIAFTRTFMQRQNQTTFSLAISPTLPWKDAYNEYFHKWFPWGGHLTGKTLREIVVPIYEKHLELLRSFMDKTARVNNIDVYDLQTRTKLMEYTDNKTWNRSQPNVGLWFLPTTTQTGYSNTGQPVYDGKLPDWIKPSYVDASGTLVENPISLLDVVIDGSGRVKADYRGRARSKANRVLKNQKSDIESLRKCFKELMAKQVAEVFVAHQQNYWAAVATTLSAFAQGQILNTGSVSSATLNADAKKINDAFDDIKRFWREYYEEPLEEWINTQTWIDAATTQLLTTYQLWDQIGRQAGRSLRRRTGTAAQYTGNGQINEAYYAPVFPVSDEKGFEHFGTYSYGRGMTLSTLAQVMTNDVNMWRNLSPEEMQLFLTSLVEINDDGHAVGSRNPQEAYNLLARERKKTITTVNDSLAEYVASRKEGAKSLGFDTNVLIQAGITDPKNSEQIFRFLQSQSQQQQSGPVPANTLTPARLFEQAFYNNIVTDWSNYGKRIDANSVPIELSELDTTYSPTACNGGGGAAIDSTYGYLIQEDRWSFAFTGQGFDETAYLQEEAGAKIIDWVTHQQALRGEVQSTGTLTMADFGSLFGEDGYYTSGGEGTLGDKIATETAKLGREQDRYLNKEPTPKTASDDPFIQTFWVDSHTGKRIDED